MRRRNACRLALSGSAAVAVIAATGGRAGAHPFHGWDGRKGPFAWEAKRLTCGVVGQQRARIRAHSRWKTSPANGYQRVTFVRQIREDGVWTTAQRGRIRTRNTRLEGNTGILHWTQFFRPLPSEVGKMSRVLVTFEWLRDRRAKDTLALRRSVRLVPCVVAG